MRIFCTACFYYEFNTYYITATGNTARVANRFCHRSNRKLESPRRPEWCKIKIVPIEDVRSVLDAKTDKYANRIFVGFGE